MKSSERMRPLPIAVITGLLVLLVLPLAFAPRTEGFVYWTSAAWEPSNDPEVYGTIVRANLDGTGLDPSFINTGNHTGMHTSEAGIAVDANHIYWTADYHIGRANVDGTNVDGFISTGSVGGPLGVAVDANHIYWTHSEGTIGRANLDGTGVDQSFITGASAPYGVAVDANSVYWTNSATDTIGRANLDGTGVDQSFITGASDPEGIAVDSDHIYWKGSYGIARANLNRSEVNLSFIDDPWVGGGDSVAVDAAHIYWEGVSTDAISRATLDLETIDSVFIRAPYFVEGIAVDGLTDSTRPKTKITKHPPNKTEETEVKFKFTSSEPNSTFECKLDKKPWKSCTSPHKLERLKKGKHKFKVRAIDAAGNADPTPAKDKFKVVGR